jgi:hypothetical protein
MLPPSVRRTGSRSWAIAGAVGLAALSAGFGEARAYEAEVHATMDAQFYTLASPYGDPVIRRRRYTQTLALQVWGIGGDATADVPELTFKARLRLDGDFGQHPAERSPGASGRYIPGLQEGPVDVMVAFLEGRGYLGGAGGFRLGRQYVVDSLGWWSFDGALLRVTTPAYLELEAYGGFEQRGGLPIQLGTSRFESDGVYRGSRKDLGLEQYPYFLEESKLAPAYGVALQTTGLHWLAARVSYRKVINRDRVIVSPFPDSGGGFLTVGGDRVSSERIGSSFRISNSSLGAAKGHLVYDFYTQLASEHGAALDAYATDEITVGAEYDYFKPSFDGDSIWNWFTSSGMTTVLGRAELRPSRRFDVTASGGVKLFETEGDPDTFGDAPTKRDETGRLTDLVGALGARYRFTEGSIGLRSMAEGGERGRRVGGDVRLERAFDSGFYDLLLVTSLYDWSDGLRPQRDATSVSYVVGGGMRPLDKSRLGLEWEHSMNRLVGHRFRLLATLDLSVWL